MGLPIPNLDDKTFEELVKEARALIPRYTPGWTDHNVHDPGITFIELFAWLAEMQIYQLNRLTYANYLKFLKMVGIYPFSAQPARVDITLQNVTEEKIIEAGTQIITEVGTERIVFETEEDFTLIPVSLKSVKTKYDLQIIDNTQANEKDDIYFYAFGERAPEGAELLLGFDKPLPDGEIHITFDIFQGDLPLAGSHGDEQLTVVPSITLIWEYWDGAIWKELTVKKDTTLSLTKGGRIVFVGPPSMDNKNGLYWVRGRLKDGHYEIVPYVNSIILNTVSAVQIETIQNEDLGTGRGIPEHKVFLKKPPVIKGSQVIMEQEENGEWMEWKEVDDFESSGPDEPHYIFDPEKGEVTFGNGLNGRIPLETQSIAASYKATLGSRGNIPKGQKFSIDSIEGENLEKAAGGKDAESIDNAKDRAKKDFRIPYRAITSDDYERLALSTPGLRVARAKALPNYHPDYPCISNFPGAVTVVVVPFTREGTVTPIPSEGFLQTVRNHLEMHRLVTTDIYVIGPEYVKVSVKCKVRIKRKIGPEKVTKRVKEALESFLDPLRGGEDERGWPFGRPVYLSEIYQIIDEVEGVDYATGVSISAEEYHQKGDVLKIQPTALVYSGEHQIEVM